MLRKVRIRNFRCLKDVSFSLAPLTAFVGANASGKSSILRALDPDAPLAEHDRRHHLPDQIPAFSLEMDGKRGVSSQLGVTNSLRYIGADYQYQLLRLDLTSLRQPNQLMHQERLVTDGSNLSNVFDSLSRERQVQVAQQLSRLVPAVTDVDARPAKGTSGQNSLYFRDRWNPDVWYTPYEVSDGTILLVAYLVLQFQTPAVDLLAIEEPERGLHPYLLGELVSLLRELASGKNGKPIQVILATHSAELLECLKPEEVRFLRRRPEDGSVEVEEAPAGTPEWEQAFQEYRRSLGSAWLSGGLGGVPGR